jgi:guanylate kinase
LPPSLNDLQSRLIKRNQDHPEIITKRLANAKETVSHIHEFDYVVINDDFTRALHDLILIIEAGRLLQARQTQQFAKLIDALVNMQA